MKVLLSSDEIERTLNRLASQILEHEPDPSQLLLVGIQRRGADIAHRLTMLLKALSGRDAALGTLDINLYRDDWTSLSSAPEIGLSHIPLPIDGKTIILVDDVLYTGRTVRAAMEALSDYGRPRCIRLSVLIDRGHRELPIQADLVGKQINTSRTERIHVLVREQDGLDEVRLLSADDPDA